ncbi:MAG: energy transducer TonB [Acidobacteriaceae bacterium]
MKRVWVLWIAGFVAGLGTAFAQEPMAVDAVALRQHKLHDVPLAYPAIAAAARIQGTVVVQITVDSSGNVVETKVISGPPMLQQAALDCVKQWKYRPFEKDGAAVPAAGRLSLIFSLGDSEVGHGPPSAAPPNSQTITVHVTAPDPTPIPDEEIAQPYFKAFEECTSALTAGTRNDVAAAACREAADLAAQFPAGQRFIERRSANVYAATALARVGNWTDALVFANRAVDVVKLGHDDNSGSNAAYGIRGMVEGRMDELAASDTDLTTAEDYERKGLIKAGGTSPFLTKEYRRALVDDLRVHADVLTRLNRPSEAQTKLDEAASLQPVG